MGYPSRRRRKCQEAADKLKNILNGSPERVFTEREIDWAWLLFDRLVEAANGRPLILEKDDEHDGTIDDDAMATAAWKGTR